MHRIKQGFLTAIVIAVLAHLSGPASAQQACTQTAAAMQSQANQSVAKKFLDVDNDFNALQKLKPSNLSCLDRFMNINLSTGSLSGLLGRIVDSLVNSLKSAVCNKVDTAWNDSMQELNATTRNSTTVNGWDGRPINVSSSLLSGNSSGLTVGPSVNTSNSILNSSTSTSTSKVSTGLGDVLGSSSTSTSTSTLK